MRLRAQRREVLPNIVASLRSDNGLCLVRDRILDQCAVGGGSDEPE